MNRNAGTIKLDEDLPALPTVLPEYSEFGHVPLNFYLALHPVFVAPSDDPHQIVLDVDGDEVARIPFRVQYFDELD